MSLVCTLNLTFLGKKATKKGNFMWNIFFSYLKWPQTLVSMHLQVTRVGPPRPNFSLQSILMQNSSKISNVATRLANPVEFVKSSQRTAIRPHGLRTWKNKIGPKISEKNLISRAHSTSGVLLAIKWHKYCLVWSRDTVPLLICKWFLKNQFGKIKFGELDV